MDNSASTSLRVIALLLSIVSQKCEAQLHNRESNILCNETTWSPITISGGIFNLDSYGPENCSLIVSNATSTIPRMWFGDSAGSPESMYSKYSYNSFILTAEFSIDAIRDSSYGEVGLFFRLSEWSSTAWNSWYFGQGYSVNVQTEPHRSAWVRRITRSEGHIPVTSSVTVNVSQDKRLSIQVATDPFDVNTYNVTINGQLVFRDLDLSSYGLVTGVVGVWSHYTDFTVHSLRLQETFNTTATTPVPTELSIDSTLVTSFAPTNDSSATSTIKPDTLKSISSTPLQSGLVSMQSTHVHLAKKKSDTKDNGARVIFAIGAVILVLVGLLGIWCCCRSWRRGAKDIPRTRTFSFVNHGTRRKKNNMQQANVVSATSPTGSNVVGTFGFHSGEPSIELIDDRVESEDALNIANRDRDTDLDQESGRAGPMEGLESKTIHAGNEKMIEKDDEDNLDPERIKRMNDAVGEFVATSGTQK